MGDPYRTPVLPLGPNGVVFWAKVVSTAAVTGFFIVVSIVLYMRFLDQRPCVDSTILGRNLAICHHDASVSAEVIQGMVLTICRCKH